MDKKESGLTQPEKEIVNNWIRIAKLGNKWGEMIELDPDRIISIGYLKTQECISSVMRKKEAVRLHIKRKTQ